MTKVSIAEAMSGFVREWLQAGRVKLAVLCGSAEAPWLGCHALLDEPPVSFVPPERLGSPGPLPFRASAVLSFILPGEERGLRNLRGRMAQAADCDSSR